MSEADFFRQPLAEMIDPRHPLVVRAAAAGRRRLPVRLMTSLLYLKRANKLSDEELVERWAENVIRQHFSGMRFYEPCDATQIGTIDTAAASKAIKPAEFERLIVDTTGQEKAIAHPVDSRLLEIARHIKWWLRPNARALRSSEPSSRKAIHCAAQSRWLRPRQAVQAPAQGRQMPAHDPGDRAARGGAQDRTGQRGNGTDSKQPANADAAR